MAGAAVAMAAVATAPSAAAGVPGWAIQATPNPGTTADSVLEAVSCPSAAACLAVGSNKGPAHVFFAVAEVWDGTSWTSVPPVKPAIAAVSDLRAVSCASATACTVVGFFRNSSGVTYPLAERWNGTSWALQAPQYRAGSTNTELAGVSCVSAMACTAVGDSVNGSTGSVQDLAEFWDGRTIFGHHPQWTIQPTQAAFSKIDYELNAVSCSSTADCLAVGQYISYLAGGARFATWAEHWNGTSWTGELPDVASSGYNDLGSVSCTSATACTTVGAYQDASGMNFPLAERWNGTSWALQSPEFPASSAGTVLSGVSCASATACTAVGDAVPPTSSANSRVTLAESWDGTSWTLGSTPNPMGATESTLNGVSCPSAAVCTAIGWWYGSSATGTSTLAERYS